MVSIPKVKENENILGGFVGLLAVMQYDKPRACWQYQKKREGWAGQLAAPKIGRFKFA